MAIRPILFNTEMVRAIIDGRKTCTRRIVRPPYFVDGDENDKRSLIVLRTAAKNSSLYRQIGQMPYPDAPYRMCDILYVRETWHKYIKRIGEGKNCHLAEFYGYKANVLNSEDANEPWHPSIHMPKEAARIWIKVTDVRVERLKDMTNNDALKEGAEGVKCNHAGLGVYGCTDCMNTGWLEPPLLEFIGIWNSTIKKSDIDRYGWDANPWVWVIEFERCEKPENL